MISSRAVCVCVWCVFTNRIRRGVLHICTYTIIFTHAWWRWNSRKCATHSHTHTFMFGKYTQRVEQTNTHTHTQCKDYLIKLTIVRSLFESHTPASARACVCVRNCVCKLRGVIFRDFTEMSYFVVLPPAHTLILQAQILPSITNNWP